MGHPLRWWRREKSKPGPPAPLGQLPDRDDNWGMSRLSPHSRPRIPGALRTGTISLVGCVVCAVTTLFAISILYDYSRSKGKAVHWVLLLFFALPEAYFAVMFFFRGFINLVQLSSLAQQ